MNFKEKFQKIQEAKEICKKAGYEVLFEDIDNVIADDNEFEDDNDSLDIVTTVSNAIEAGEIDATEFATSLIDYLSTTNKQVLENFLETNYFI